VNERGEEVDVGDSGGVCGEVPTCGVIFFSGIVNKFSKGDEGVPRIRLFPLPLEKRRENIWLRS